MNQENNYKPKKIKKTLVVILCVLVLMFAFGAILRFTPLGKKVPLPQFAKNIIVGQSQEEKAKQETQRIVKKVGALIDLPKGEQPVIATVQDKDLLVKEQKFFEGAENGDTLIIYPQAAKAILYSPKRNVLVNVGPIITSGSQDTENSQTDASTKETAPNNTPAPSSNALKIEIRNGTEKNGLANTVKQTLSGNALFEVTTVADAGRKDYENTIIIDTGKSQDKNTLNQLSQVLGANIIQDLPAEEGATSADALVILGKDRADN